MARNGFGIRFAAPFGARGNAPGRMRGGSPLRAGVDSSSGRRSTVRRHMANLLFFFGVLAGLIGAGFTLATGGAGIVTSLAAGMAAVFALFWLLSLKFPGKTMDLATVAVLIITFMICPALYLTGGETDGGICAFFALGLALTLFLVPGRAGWVLTGVESLYFVALMALSYRHIVLPHLPQLSISEEGRRLFSFFSIGTNVVLVGIAVCILCRSLFNAFLKENRMTDAAIEEAVQRSELDPLSGLYNRTALYRRLDSFIGRARQTATTAPDVLQAENTPQASLSVILFDVDYFKFINDEFGHPVGDACIVKLARLLADRCGGDEFVARYGGEEFVMVLPGARRDEAAVRAEEVRRAVEGARFRDDMGEPLQVTVSAGVAAWDGEQSNEALLSSADARMYSAKEAGRNRVDAGPGTDPAALYKAATRPAAIAEVMATATSNYANLGRRAEDIAEKAAEGTAKSALEPTSEGQVAQESPQQQTAAGQPKETGASPTEAGKPTGTTGKPANRFLRFLQKDSVETIGVKQEVFLLLLQESGIGLMFFFLLHLALTRSLLALSTYLPAWLFVRYLYVRLKKSHSVSTTKWLYICYCFFFGIVWLPALYLFCGGLNSGIPLVYIYFAASAALLLNGPVLLGVLAVTTVTFFLVLGFDLFTPGLVESYTDLTTHSYLFTLLAILFVGIAIGNATRLLYRNFLENRKFSEELMGQLEETTMRDPLTGAYDRRFLIGYLEESMDAVDEGSISGFSLIMLDMDHLKDINDRYGHLTGDSCIRKLATLIRSNLRASDVLTRYGGEEFICVLRGADGTAAARRAEELRQLVAENSLSPELQQPVTISCGVVTYRPGMDVSDLIRLADDRLYRAKRRGRNQVVGSH